MIAIPDRLVSRVQGLVGAALLLSASLSAQDGSVAGGSVLDAATRRPISGAVIAVLEAQPRGLPARPRRALSRSAANPHEPVTFRLPQAALALDPVTVSAERTFSSSAESWWRRPTRSSFLVRSARRSACATIGPAGP